MRLSPILGKDNTVEHLLPLVLQLLKDEFPDVRLNIIANLHHINEVIGIELLSKSLLPAIVELAKDRQWRVRLAIINYIPLLAHQLGQAFFDEKLKALCMRWLTDPVFAIRQAGTLNMQELVRMFGSEWALESLLPPILAMHTQSNYLQRMTVLFVVNVVAPLLGASGVESILPVICTLANDPVANVRFNVAKTLKIMCQHMNESIITSKVNGILQTLKEDTDEDVVYFAEEALATCPVSMVT